MDHRTNGITVKKEVLTPVEERFQTPRPIYTPRNLTYLKPPPRDNTPAVSVATKVSGTGLAQRLLEEAKARALQATQTAVVAPRDRSPRTPKTSVTQATTTKAKTTPWFCEAHKLSDKDFIAVTRHPMLVSHRGGMSLLYANGGGKYVDAGLTHAQAWDLLRREIMVRLKKESR